MKSLSKAVENENKIEKNKKKMEQIDSLHNVRYNENVNVNSELLGGIKMKKKEDLDTFYR